MSSLAVRLEEIDSSELHEFIELWVECKSQQYVRIERVGAANDKGRDVICYSSKLKHEGPWDLYQCKRKTLGRKLGTPEGINELCKLFYHHVEGAYRTLPMAYTFVSPRGVVGPLRDLIFYPSTLGGLAVETFQAGGSARDLFGTPDAASLRFHRAQVEPLIALAKIFRHSPNVIIARADSDISLATRHTGCRDHQLARRSYRTICHTVRLGNQPGAVPAETARRRRQGSDRRKG